MSKRKNPVLDINSEEPMSLAEANTFVADVMAYKAIYALCTYGNGVMRATHLTCCLTLGKAPVWGVWTIRGRFLRFYGNKASIEAAYPSLMWRRKSASFMLAKVSDIDVGGRRKELETRYAQQVPDPEVTTDGQRIVTAKRRAKVAA